MSRSLLVVAGEISGDMHAAGVVRALREQRPEVACWGIGGDELRAAGMEVLYDVRDMSVLGLWEVLKRYGFFRRVFAGLLAEMESRRPDALLLVDYPGFNLRLAQEAHRRGIKVLYYICPQVWAWHRSRIRKMAECLTRLMVIFPFEVDVFRAVNLPVDFVGHPLVDQAAAARAAPPVELPWPAGEGPRVALLPGSRRQEVERILPPMLGAAQELARRRPGVSFLVAAPSEAIAACARAVLARQPSGSLQVEVVIGRTRAILLQARAAMVASGTATIESALLGCPQIVVYKTAPLTYWVGKRVVRVPYLGMVNLVAGRGLCPEFLQAAARPAAMAAALLPLLDDTPERAAMVAGLAAVAETLAGGNPSRQAAAIVAEELGAA